MQTAGNTLRDAIQIESPLAIVGTINAFTALLAQQAGFKAIYLSGAGVANASYGLPDLGVTNLTDVVTDIQRITYATELPLLVDADTGWGNEISIARTVKAIARAGAAGLHIEDQSQDKRCGHRPGKKIVATAEMVDRIKAAADGREDSSFVIMARTDALANEGLDAALERAQQYLAAGADMLFPEAVQTLAQYQAFSQATGVPILANITEFGKTPLFTQEELAQASVHMALYPLSAFRAMNKAALQVYQTIKTQGTQHAVLPDMQTREELYATLNYYADEEKT